MPLSDDNIKRCHAAVEALKAVRKEFEDVLVVLDYVALSDINSYQPDSIDVPAGEILSEEEMAAVLWHVGKHVGGSSQDVLAYLVEFALEEHKRREMKQ